MALVTRPGGGAIKPARALTFKDSDFIDEETVKNQALVTIVGTEGTGKTTFGIRFSPEPVSIISFDGRATRAIKREQDRGRAIRHCAIPYSANIARMTADEAKRAAQAIVDKTMHNYEVAVRESQRGNCRTIVLDTGTEFSEIVTLAIRGTLEKVKGDYGQTKDMINQCWRRLYHLAREGNAHVIMLARAKAVWVDNEPSGAYTYRGNEALGELADWVGHIRLRRNNKTGLLMKKIEIEILKAGNNLEELGAVYRDRDWEDAGGPFVYACWKQYPKSKLEDWE